MAEAGIGALAAKSVKLGASLGMDFTPPAVNVVVNALDKVGFDLDKTGREKQALRMEEQARIAYSPHRVNIAIWNMHLEEEHHFNGIVFSGIQKMSNGGGFKIAVFTGNGYLKNKGDGGYCNWICSGNHHKNGNVVTFESLPDLPDVNAPAPAPAPAPAQRSAGVLHPGQSLWSQSHDTITSPNGRVSLHQQPDSHLVLYSGSNPIWSNNMWKRGVTRTTMQEDGNLVSYTSNNTPVWASDTWGNPGAYLRVQDDGNLVIYVESRPIWASNTCGK